MVLKADSRADLSGAIPIRVYRRQPSASPWVDWCYLDGRRLTEPFFDQTVESCLSRPATLLFRPQTPIELLGDLYEHEPGPAPQGFIFHMSRCGSTLIAQMLAALPNHVVVSEADPLHWALRGELGDERITAELRATWLRWLVSALGRGSGRADGRLFIKMDGFGIFDFPIIRSAFPEVPWIFLYREPLEVMVSHLRRRGAQMVPGPYGARVLGLPPAVLAKLKAEEYCARMLARICAAALEHHDAQPMLLVNYTQLPEVVSERILGFFGTELAAAELQRMRQVTSFDAKNSALRFVADAAQKRQEASPLVRGLVETWVDPYYRRLEAHRLGTLPQSAW